LGVSPDGCRATAAFFYHLEFSASTSQEDWDVFSDNHTFHAFWAPLDHLPAIVKPQDAWLDYVTGQLNYKFPEPPQ